MAGRFDGAPFSLEFSMRVIVAVVLLSPLSALAETTGSQDYETLLQVDTRGGRVLRFPGLEDLTQAGAAWSGAGEVSFEVHDGGQGCYGVDFNHRGVLLGARSLKLMPNRRYVISILLNTNFERPAEINVGVRNYDVRTNRPLLFNFGGIPCQTEGWRRWEWGFTADARCGTELASQFWLSPYGVPKDAVVRIADIALIELPAEPLCPYARGKGVTFRGGPGCLPMKVEDVTCGANEIQVRTTGALYQLDLAAGILHGQQLLEKNRALLELTSSLPLSDLKVLRRSDKECVLGNDELTIGIQCDGMVFLVPHAEAEFTLKSRIGGIWSRIRCGHLLVVDDYGGFSVNPDIPLGSGRLARTRVLTPDLDFVDIPLGEFGNTKFLSQAEPGWQIRWKVSPGERLAVSVFPPRPFDWEGSFHALWGSTHRGVPLDSYEKCSDYLDSVVLWNFFQRGYGMSWGPHFIPFDEAELRAHIDAIKTAGMRPAPYMSMYFYYSRDPEEFVGEVKKIKDRFGIEGLYSDGNPSQEWVVAYEEIRMLRELFPDGSIILHTTGQALNGGPPLAQPDIFIPAIDTYATVTYRGEWVPHDGPDWLYPKYISSQYRKANCFGMQKGDRWSGVTQLEQDLINLRYNGIPCRWETVLRPPLGYRETYLPIRRLLETLWQENGREPDFYEKHYLPMVQRSSQRESHELPGVQATQ